MRSQSNSPVVTFFMLAPLLAIPLLAVFGIPNLQTSKSISAAIEDDIELGDANSASPSEMDKAIKPEEPFVPIEMDDVFSEESASSQHHRATAGHHSKTVPAVHHPEALQGWSVEEASNSRSQNQRGRQSLMGSPSRRDISGQFEYVKEEDLSAELTKTSVAQVRSNSFLQLSDEEQGGHKQVASSEGDVSRNPFLEESPATSFKKNTSDSTSSAALPTTWKAAVARLNQYGITDFNLQPGVNENEFYFNCSYIPKNNSRIIHRFESEASDPLKAVQNAISQIEDWQQKR